MAKILIVDDSETSRSVMKRLLGDKHELVEASSGLAALDLVSGSTFDLVFLDLLMPGMGGLEVLAELAARSCTVPVIVVTADIQNSTRLRVQALGAAGQVNKPLKKETLEAAIESVLSKSRRGAGLVLDPLVKDSFEELMNIAIGKAAEVLNTMLNSPIVLTVPAIEILSVEELTARFSHAGPKKLSAIEMRCFGGLDASIELIFTSDDAIKLAECLMGTHAKERVDVASMRSGALCEIGNVVINAVLGTISNMLEIDLTFTVPSYLEGLASALVGEIYLATQEVILLVRTRFEIEDLKIDGDIALFLSFGSFKSLAAMLREKMGAA